MKKSFLIVFVMILVLSAALFAGGSREAAGSTGRMSLEELRAFAAPELDEVEMLSASGASANPAAESGAGGASLLSREAMRETERLAVTVDRAVDLALKYNLGLKGDQLDLVKKRRAMRTVWNSFIPTVQASTTMNRFNKEPEPFFPGLPASPRWGLSAGLDFNLMLNLALFDGITSTQLAYESGLLSYEEARKQLERDVRKTFYNLLLMKENRALFVQQIDAAESRYRQAQVNYRNGLVPELSMLSAQVAWENLKPALESMDLGYDQYLAGFKMTLGLSQETELDLEGAISVDPVELAADPLIEEYLAGRLDIASLLYGMETIEVARRATISQAFTPNLVLGLNFDPTLGGDPWETSWFDTDNWAQRSGMFRLTVAMNLEGFLPGSKPRVALANLEDDRRSMQLGLMQAIEGAEMEINSLVKSLNKSRRSMSTLRLNVELADRAYRMAEEAYRAGSRELLEVQSAEIELNKANYELLKEKFNYVTGLLDLEYALNTSLEEIKDGNDE
jgi:outer membrane protein TolC